MLIHIFVFTYVYDDEEGTLEYEYPGTDICISV
jgi:hypothetical protein